jgi:hypothetical protein
MQPKRSFERETLKAPMAADKTQIAADKVVLISSADIGSGSAGIGASQGFCTYHSLTIL